ncbi:hypothetical protein [Streptomyces luteireticuli]
MSAVSLREGDALRPELKSGGRFVVTVDDARTAAELVLHHLRRRARGR